MLPTSMTRLVVSCPSCCSLRDYPTHTLGIIIFQSLDFTCFPAGTPDKPVSLGNEPGELREGQDTRAPSSCITPEQESQVINSLCHFSQFKKR